MVSIDNMRCGTYTYGMEKISETIRRAINNSDESIRGIARGAGVDHAAVVRFVNRTRTITADTLDKLAMYLGLEVKARKQRAKKRRP